MPLCTLYTLLTWPSSTWLSGDLPGRDYLSVLRDNGGLQSVDNRTYADRRGNDREAPKPDLGSSVVQTPTPQRAFTAALTGFPFAGECVVRGKFSLSKRVRSSYHDR
jgi:hypothetical protein